NQYFQTANYADQAIEEFFSWLQESGVYENSIIVMYGDHYGVSNARNPVLGEDLFGIPQNEWSGYHDTQKQRVPMMIHIPGSDSGKIIDKYTGQVDILPTLLHLLGINTDPYLFMGQDM
ncbi:LTA synthase family protein, partial [Salmonella enterica]|uniref:LTA synthase family protein n=1 Tax=Salmonella enterica TaxID=28901 RepID=UPI000CA82E3F